MASASVELKSSIEAQLNEHYQKKREIEDNLNELQGRPTRKQREEALANGEELIPHPASRDRRRISDQGLPSGAVMFGNIRSRLSMDNRRRRYDEGPDDAAGYNSAPKRNRLSLNERFAERDPERETRMGAYGRRERRTATQAYGQGYVDADIVEEVKGKAVQSEIVVMPMIDTKSRDEAIKEQETDVKPEVKQRNRRLFAGLLGTLQSFRKTKTAHEDEQKRKQEEIDRKIEEEKRRSKEEMLLEKRKLVANSREEAEKIKTLQRKRAQIQIAEREIDRMRLLGNYIMVAGKPPIFYLPAKHTLRTLELQKTTRKKFEERIKVREDELEKDLKAIEEKFGGRQQGEREQNGGERDQRDRRANTEEREMRREERINENVEETEEMRLRRNMVTPTSDIGEQDEDDEVKVNGDHDEVSPKKIADATNGDDGAEEKKEEKQKKKSVKQETTQSSSSSSSSDSSDEDD